MNYIIRKRKKEDIPAIHHIITREWNETYKGIVPDWFLEDLKNNEEERIKKGYEKFDKNNNNELVLEVDGNVVGFASYGANEENENYGEIYALYIYEEYQGYGYGKKLVTEAAKKIKEMGYNEFVIACLKGNPSNEFYKHIGGKYIKDGVYKRLNLKENVYLYSNM